MLPQAYGVSTGHLATARRLGSFDVLSSVAVGPRADDFLAASADAAIVTGCPLGHENSLSPPTPTVGVQAIHG